MFVHTCPPFSYYSIVILVDGGTSSSHSPLKNNEDCLSLLLSQTVDARSTAEEIVPGLVIET